MKFSNKLAAAIFVSACALSTTANAQMDEQKSALEQIVTQFVKSAVNNATYEIEVKLEKTLLTASNAISVDSSPVPPNKVTITDLASTKQGSAKTQKIETQDNQDEKADD
jgi:hypothetical protein